MSQKYGNDHFWCFIDSNVLDQVSIWHGKEGSEEVFAYANNIYDAKMIVDALILQLNQESNTGTLSRKETNFLSFCKSHLPEPYSTMAANAILWNDKEAYKQLITKFVSIY